MTKREKTQWTVVIIEIAATIVLGVLSVIIPAISREGTFIIVTIGVSVTLLTAILHYELNASFTRQYVKTVKLLDDRLEVYRITYNLTDPELITYAHNFLEEFKEKVRDLEKGKIVFEHKDVFKVAIEKMKETKPGSRVLAVHSAHTNIHYLYAFEDFTPLDTYFEENVAAFKRGVDTERIFTLNKKDVLDETKQRFIDERALKIMQKHQDVGFKVYVAFEDEIRPRMQIKDCSIFVDSSVQVREHDEKTDYRISVMHKNPVEINKCIEDFMRLKTCSHTLADLLKKYPLKKTVKL
jgi:hypothetical protein